MTNNNSSSKGFTLLEVLLVISILALIAGFAIPLSQQFQRKTDLENAIIHTVQALRSTLGKSTAIEENSSWGVYAQLGGLTIFQGVDFLTRDPSFDETLPFPPTVQPSGTTEFVFQKLSGEPLSAGTLTLSSFSDSHSITVTSTGSIEY